MSEIGKFLPHSMLSAKVTMRLFSVVSPTDKNQARASEAIVIMIYHTYQKQTNEKKAPKITFLSTTIHDFNHTP